MLVRHLWILGICLPTLAWSQILDEQITVRVYENTIAESIEKVSQVAQFDYSYDANLIQDKKTYSATYNGTVREVLSEILKNEKIDFKEISGQILFYRRKEKKVIKTTNFIFGQIRNERGDPLQNVQIYDNEGLIDIVSSEVGRFEFTIPIPAYSMTLNFFKPGYAIKKFRLRTQGDHELSIVLQEREMAAGEPIEIEKPEPSEAFNEQNQEESTPDIFVSDRVLEAQENNDTLHFKFASGGLFPPASSKYLRAGYEINNVAFHAIADYGAEIRGFTFSGLAGIYRFDMNGMTVSGLGNWTGGNMRGLQIGGLLNNNVLRTDGLQISGVVNIAGVRQAGIQVSGVTNVNRYRAYGIQISGVYNYTRIMNAGIQISGVVNQSGNAKGMQIGLVNVAKRLDGLQIGLVNYAGSAKYGAQLGLINIVKDGYRQLQFAYDDMQFIDFSFRSGARHFFSSLHVATAFTYEEALYRLGYGLGTEWPIVGPLAVNVEGVVYHVTEQPFTEQVSALGVGKIGLAVNVIGLSFFGSVNYNAYFTDYLNDAGTGPQIPILSNPNDEQFEGEYLLQQSTGYSFGMRIFL